MVAVITQGTKTAEEPGLSLRAKRIAEAGGLQDLARASGIKLLFGLRNLTAERQLIRIADLAEKSGVSASTVERSVPKLIASGMLEGEPEPGKGWRLSRPSDPDEPAVEALWQLVDLLADVPEMASWWTLGYSALSLFVSLCALDSIGGVVKYRELSEISGLNKSTIGDMALPELMAAGLLRGRAIQGVGLEYSYLLLPPPADWLPSAVEFYSRRLAKRLKRNKKRDQQARNESKKSFRNDLRENRNLLLGDDLPGLNLVAVGAMEKLATGENRRTPDSPVIQELVAAGLVTIRAGQPLLNAPVKDGIARLARSLAGWALARPSAKRLYIALRENSSPGTTREISERSGVHVRWLARSLRELSLLKWIDAEHDGEVWRIKLLDPPPELPAAAMLFYFDPIWQRRQRIEAMIERLEREAGSTRRQRALLN